MSPRARGIFIVMLSFFAGGLSTHLVDWSFGYKAILAGAVTVAVAVVLLLVVPKAT